MTLTASGVVEQKKHLLEHEVSTSAWKSPFQLKEWFCTVDLEKYNVKQQMAKRFLSRENVLKINSGDRM